MRQAQALVGLPNPLRVQKNPKGLESPARAAQSLKISCYLFFHLICFPFLIFSLRPKLEPVILKPGDDVDMDMVNDLACWLAVAVSDVKPIRASPFSTVLS